MSTTDRREKKPHLDPPLAHWLELCLKAPLPILPHTALLLAQQFKNNHIAMPPLAATVARDPVATLCVLRAANQFAKNTNPDLEITSITHCLTVLGYEQTHSMLCALTPIEAGLDCSSYVYFGRSLMQSLHAAYQAKHFAQYRLPHLANQVFVGTLLSNMPQWALWQVAPAQMRLLTHLQFNERLRPEAAQNAVLGSPIAPLAAAMAAHWQLPKVIQAACNTLKVAQIKALVRAARLSRQGQLGALPQRTPEGYDLIEPQCIAQLASWLALETDMDWCSRHTRRVTGMIAAFISQPVARTQAMIRANAFQASRHYHLPGIISPGEQIMQAPAHPITQDRAPRAVKQIVSTFMAEQKILAKAHTVQAPMPEDLAARLQWISATTRPAPHSQSALKDAKLYHNLFAQLKDNSESFLDTAGVLHTVARCIASAVGLSSVVILRLDRHKNVLQTSEVAGLTHPLLLDLVLALDQVELALFRKLLQKPVALHCQNTPEQQNIIKLMPTVFQQAGAGKRAFFLSSFFTHAQPTGIIYAEAGETDAALQEAHYAFFKTIVKLGARCIELRKNSVSKNSARNQPDQQPKTR